MSDQPDSERPAPLQFDLPYGTMSLGYILLVKALDADGELVVIHEAEGLNEWEEIGMLPQYVDNIKTEPTWLQNPSD